MLLSLKIINLKGSCFWLRENIEFYNENSNFGKTHFSLERVLPCTPDFYFVTIVLGNKGEIKVKRPKGCHC